MSVRIIDTISELDDTKEVSNEWDWLVEPLTSTITLNVAHDPYALYLDSEEKTKYYGFPIMPSSNSFDLPGDWETRYSFIIENHEVSHILIGDVGVGKTSWLHRFKCYLETLERTSIIYYDHHVERGGPDGKHLDKEIRLHCALTALLLKTIQKACIMYNLTMLDVFTYDVDRVAKSPENIEMSTTEFMKEAAKILFRDFNHRIFLIIDNLDEYGRDVQDTGISFSENCATWDGISPIVSLRPETYHFSQVRLRGPRHIRILPASLSELLNQRLNYLVTFKS
ncbi:MAG: hypothetical protein KAW87_01325, partial [Candidatus Cloacimonetes bacterium]|nr:hypothetical protein [Candidatus Cloacimonadota bacterium]